MPGLPDDAYPYPWIGKVVDFLSAVEDQSDVEVFDAGEEDGDVCVFLITGAGEEELLAAASRVAMPAGVPAGSFAVVGNDESAEVGLGRRVPLPWPAERGPVRNLRLCPG
ncbi:hypothetical protein AB0919_14395 [Streptomyces sp. NPDC046994]|uniref:hypothetical protein n=1 Tax=Streptomyces sp. NPDC046994 TaxID=3155735 RepID=UPI0034559FF4